MSVTEESRHRLHQALDRTIGPEEATTLMEHLPPVGWVDVATKTDLAHLREHVDARFTAARTDVDHLRANLDHRFETVELRFGHVAEDMKRYAEAAEVRQTSMERRLDAIENRLTHQFWQFLTLVLAVGTILIGVLRYT